MAEEIKEFDKKPTEVTAIECPSCKDVIYSRARHDYNKCSCGEVAVDGGFDYLKFAFKTQLPEQRRVNIDVSKRELYDDWNNKIDKYGKIETSSKQSIPKKSRKRTKS